MNKPIRDVVIVGAGPSALAAAIYTTREDIDTTLYEKNNIGGLVAINDKIDNYPGFPDGIAGLELAGLLQKQAERFGANIEFGEVSTIVDSGNYKTVTVDGAEVLSRAVLVATGSDYAKLGIPGEAEYYGRGVHYCATCDGAFYRGKRLAVIGGGNSALQEAIFLTKFADHIDLLVHSTIKASEAVRRDMQPFVDEGKITIHLATTPTEIAAKDGRVVSVNAQKDGRSVSFGVDGVFVFVGLRPNTKFLLDSGIKLDADGLIKTDSRLETAIPGVFASGDVRNGATTQIASAIGEGVTAALNIRQYLDSLKSASK